MFTLEVVAAQGDVRHRVPHAMIDPAFLDRLHYYLPGWEAPKLETRLFTNHFGFVSDYFAEAMRQIRAISYSR